MSAVDPRMPTETATPHWLVRQPGVVGLILAEAWDHLWPWRASVPRPETARGFGPRSNWRLLSYTLALAATIVWALAALGELRAGAVIGWWFGWSVLEVLIRLRDKRYVKDGPWWGRRYRVATVMDMLCYVGFKNLLIGAAAFLALRALGWLLL